MTTSPDSPTRAVPEPALIAITMLQASLSTRKARPVTKTLIGARLALPLLNLSAGVAGVALAHKVAHPEHPMSAAEYREAATLFAPASVLDLGFGLATMAVRHAIIGDRTRLSKKRAFTLGVAMVASGAAERRTQTTLARARTTGPNIATRIRADLHAATQYSPTGRMHA